MDRTVLLKDQWQVFDGKDKPSLLRVLSCEKCLLPVRRESSFVLRRKIICPKQINDTVRIFFASAAEITDVFGGKKKLAPEVSPDGTAVYDITDALKSGSTVITAYFGKGEVSGFYLDVKRDKTV